MTKAAFVITYLGSYYGALGIAAAAWTVSGVGPKLAATSKRHGRRR